MKIEMRDRRSESQDAAISDEIFVPASGKRQVRPGR
jgi:hypothetical protein